MLLIVTSIVWLHEWLPALLVIAFVVWILVHDRLEGDLGQDLLRLWRRLWPPATLLLVPLLIAGTFAYWISDLPVTAKALPIALNLFALSMVACAGWRLGMSPLEPAVGSSPVSAGTSKAR